MTFEDTLKKVLREVIREELPNIVAALKEEMHIDSNHPEVLKPKEAAKIMKIGLNAVYDLCRNPDFPCIKEGRKILIPYRSLIRWMEQQSTNESSL